MGVTYVVDCFIAEIILTVGRLVQLILADPLPILSLTALTGVALKLLLAPRQKQVQGGPVVVDCSSPTAKQEEAAIAEYFRRAGAPEGPHEEAVLVPGGEICFSNGTSPTNFVNENCEGKFISLHRATHDKELDRSARYPYGTYFKGKKRLWEARVQLRFKSKPPRQEDLFFGTELREYVPMNGPTKGMMATVVKALKGAVGNQVYHSPGDDPSQGASGELERPGFVMPMWAFDQFIVTPEGETPPDLNDPNIPDMGSKRSTRVNQFRQELSDVDFKVGPTYTFCFWGISQWIDKLNCKIKVPLMGSIEASRFLGRPPMRVVMYTLAGEGGAEKRHLDSRKTYYLNVHFWSSRQRPDAESIRSILGENALDGLGGAGDAAALKAAATSKPRSGGLFACCTAR